METEFIAAFVIWVILVIILISIAGFFIIIKMYKIAAKIISICIILTLLTFIIALVFFRNK